MVARSCWRVELERRVAAIPTAAVAAILGSFRWSVNDLNLGALVAGIEDHRLRPSGRFRDMDQHALAPMTNGTPATDFRIDRWVLNSHRSGNAVKYRQPVNG